MLITVDLRLLMGTPEVGEDDASVKRIDTVIKSTFTFSWVHLRSVKKWTYCWCLCEKD